MDPTVVASAKVGAPVFFGSLLRLFLRPMPGDTAFARGSKSLWCTFVSATCGFYITGTLATHWHMTDPSSIGAVGVGVGLIGLSLAEGVLKIADNMNLWEWLAVIVKGRG